MPAFLRAAMFLAAFGLAACGVRSVLHPPEPAPIGADWILRDVGGSPLVISTPESFSEVDGAGCYEGHTQDTLRYGPGWRSFCVRLHPLEEPIPVFVVGRETGCTASCRVLNLVETTQMTLGGRDVIVQTALVSGGPEGKQRAPEMLVQMPVAPGLVILSAEYGDRADAAVILGIAQTISLTAGGRTRRP